MNALMSSTRYRYRSAPIELALLHLPCTRDKLLVGAAGQEARQSHATRCDALRSWRWENRGTPCVHAT